MINIAILGTGKIIPEAVRAIQSSKKFNVVNIWARPHSRDKAAALAKEFRIKNFTTDLNEILNDKAVDFVYIGLVNSVHFDFAKKCLAAGKNVILEKPFTTTAAQTQQLIDIALSKKLYLFEAITTLHQPNFFKIRELLSQLDNIKLVICNFSQYSSRYDAYKAGNVSPSFDPEFNGGALMDINIYNLNFVIGLFGLPKTVSYQKNIGWNGVDTSGVVSLAYDNFLAQCIAAKDSGSPSFISIQGDGGYILAHGTPNELNSFDFSLRGGEIKTFALNNSNNRMINEFIDFAEIFEAKNYDSVQNYLKISLNVMKVAEQCF